MRKNRAEQRKAAASAPSFPRKRESYVADDVRIRMPTCPNSSLKMLNGKAFILKQAFANQIVIPA